MQEQNHHSTRRSFVGSLIQQDREQAGLSLSQYAAVVGVSRVYLSRLERGIRKHPSLDVLVRIAEARGMQISDLFLATGYLSPTDLPTLMLYLRATYPHWPEQAREELTGHCRYLESKYKQH